MRLNKREKFDKAIIELNRKNIDFDIQSESSYQLSFKVSGGVVDWWVSADKFKDRSSSEIKIGNIRDVIRYVSAKRVPPIPKTAGTIDNTLEAHRKRDSIIDGFPECDPHLFLVQRNSGKEVYAKGLIPRLAVRILSKFGYKVILNKEQLK